MFYWKRMYPSIQIAEIKWGWWFRCAANASQWMMLYILSGISLLAFHWPMTCSRNSYSVIMASWVHALGRKNVFLTCLYMWCVYDCSAACRVIHAFRPEVWCYFVKMRNVTVWSCWGKATLLKSIIKSVWHSGTCLTECSPFCINWVLLLWNTWKLFVKCLLLWSHGREHPPTHTWIFCLRYRVGYCLLSTKYDCPFHTEFDQCVLFKMHFIWVDVP